MPRDPTRDIKLTLPTLDVGRTGPSGLVTPRAVRDGDLAHIKVTFRAPRLWQTDDGPVHSPRFYGIVPSSIAATWAATYPDSTLLDWEEHDLSATLGMATVRVDIAGSRRNILVPEDVAADWAEHSMRFARLLRDYNAMMSGAIR